MIASADNPGKRVASPVLIGMSFQQGIPWWVALQQSPPLLRLPNSFFNTIPSMYTEIHRTVTVPSPSCLKFRRTPSGCPGWEIGGGASKCCKIPRFTALGCYHRISGLGLRAMGSCKPRQVRKEATVVVIPVCRGSPGV